MNLIDSRPRHPVADWLETHVQEVIRAGWGGDNYVHEINDETLTLEVREQNSHYIAYYCFNAVAAYCPAWVKFDSQPLPSAEEGETLPCLNADCTKYNGTASHVMSYLR